MKKQLNKNKSKKINTPVFLILYAFASGLLFFLAACILALIFDIGRENYYIFAAASLCIGSFSSGFISARKTRQKGMLNGIIYALPSNMVFTITSAALNSFSVDFNMIITFILLIICSAAGGIASVNIRSRKIITPKHARK